MSLIRDFKQNWSPSFTGARKHVRLTIKNYSQLDKLVFHRQLDTTLRGLITAGFTLPEATEIITQELRLGGMDWSEWINKRTTSEIISN